MVRSNASDYAELYVVVVFQPVHVMHQIYSIDALADFILMAVPVVNNVSKLKSHALKSFFHKMR